MSCQGTKSSHTRAGHGSGVVTAVRTTQYTGVITKKINDMTNEELQSHIKALGQWVDGNKKRIAFAVCVEEKDDKNFESWVLQYGSDIKLAYYLASVAKNSKEIRDTLGAAGEAIKSPIGMMMLKAAMDDGQGCETVEDKDKSDLAEKIFAKLKEIFEK